MPVSDRMLRAFLEPPGAASGGGWGIIAAVIVLIGMLDYATGTDASLAICYLVPILLVTAWKGAWPGVAVAFACTITRIASDGMAIYPSLPAWSLVWNAAASFAIALLVVWLLDALLTLHRALENKIVERTTQLEQSLAERARLERELVVAGERERSSFGRELHDEIGQQLVATAFAAQALAQRLTGPLASEALAIVNWTEQAVAKTRGLARGLLLSEINPQRFVAELEELAPVARQARVEFAVEHDGAPIDTTAIGCAQLFRIAQEAVSNALRHGRPARITVSVARRAGSLHLVIEDDGTGFFDDGPSSGMGLRIMAQRARLIGAHFSVERRAPHGTRVSCILPAATPVHHG